MSRLYRGISIATNEWVYGGIYELMQGDCLCTYITIPEFDFAPCVNKSIGQNTGLQDKNGVDIYEGDIVRGYVHEPKYTFYVKFHASNYSCGFVATNNEDCNPYVNIWYEGFKVIGNIYENPELLEQS